MNGNAATADRRGRGGPGQGTSLLDASGQEGCEKPLWLQLRLSSITPLQSVNFPTVRMTRDSVYVRSLRKDVEATEEVSLS